MRYVKFSGILQEIMALYPNVELRDFLAEKLDIPLDKAEVLAERIKRNYCQDIERPEQTAPTTILEKATDSNASKASAYSVECLSQKEFGYFIKWLFEELGYEVKSDKSTDYGLDLVVTKGNRKTAVLAFRNPKTFTVSNSIVSLCQQATRTYGCESAIVLSTSHFTEQARLDVHRLEIELWDSDTLDRKIAEIRKNSSREEHYCFPPYQGSLLQSLLKLGDAKNFIIESRAGEKYDLFLPGVKYPLLTFQAESGRVIGCILRIRYNEPVGEAEGTALISSEPGSGKVNPDDVSAYGLIIQYLEGFLE